MVRYDARIFWRDGSSDYFSDVEVDTKHGITFHQRDETAFIINTDQFKYVKMKPRRDDEDEDTPNEGE